MVTTLLAELYNWLNFVVVGWRITKPPEQAKKSNQQEQGVPTTSGLILPAGNYSIGLAVFIFVMIRINLLSLPNYMKAIISLSIAQVGSFLPAMTYMTSNLFKARKWDPVLKKNGKWLYILAPLGQILLLGVGPIIFVPGLDIIILYSIIRPTIPTKETQTANDFQMQIFYEAITSPKRLFVANVASVILLAVSYWLFGFRENLVWFLAPAFLLIISSGLFSIVIYTRREVWNPAQDRPFNPVAMAGSLIILFSFYIALLLNHPEQTTAYLVGSALFLGVLWYFSYLSRSETTIEIGRDTYDPPNSSFSRANKDYDFQVDSANLILTLFSRLIWFLYPVFFALGVSHAEGASKQVYINAWFASMKVVVVMTLIHVLTCLFIWTRNIREKQLDVAGKNRRVNYPDYRDRLASSALPYCIIIPALLYAFLNLMGLSPISLPGLEGSTWLDITIYTALTLILIGLFIQFPYRIGAKAWNSPEHMALENQIKLIKEGIKERRENLVKSNSAGIAMQNISDELTLNRLSSELDKENKSKKLSYNISWPGGMEKDSAFYFVVNFFVAAFTTAIATNLDRITKFLLNIPK